MPQPPSGTVTFLFTDIEGSTRLWESAPNAMRVALERHDAVLRAAIEAREGYVFSTGGDGYAVAFARAGDALAAAIDAQHALAAEPWPEGTTIRVRMGVHTGEAAERNGDYFGPPVNRTARLMAIAHGGQVLCTQATAALAGPDTSLRSLGEHRLRDLAAAEQVLQVGDGMFPSLRSVDAVPTNLPTVRTELIGRTDDVMALSDLVMRERLVTLTGVGGVGKTRLALAVAAAVAPEFDDGCWLVELAPVSGGDEVVKVVASALRSPTIGTDALADYLAERHVFVVLDNCEHVLDAAADLVDLVLASAADVHVLVTSREPLGLDGEQVRRVQSLQVPEAETPPGEVRAAAAVRLFAERAAAVAGGFIIDDGNVAAVVEICRHLDGIPLAIELAAARVRSMPPAEIARRLDERFRLLAGGSRRSQERHRTLFAAVSWSHELLTDDEKVTFQRLGVFPASFDLAAAEAVAGKENADIVDCVLRLVDRSLVAYEPDAGRYRLLETLRQFSADRLAEAGETEDARARHARYFGPLVEDFAPALDGVAYTDTAAALVSELDNLRATADWCVEAGWWAELAAMCRSLWFFITQHAPVDGVTWYHQFLDHAAALNDQVVADALGELAFLEVYNFGNYDAANVLSEWSRELADATALHVPQTAWVATAMTATFEGDSDAALYAAERAFAAAESRSDEKMALSALFIEASALSVLGELDRATDVANEALRRAKLYGHPVMITAAVVSVAGLYSGSLAEPDFVTCLEILTHEDVGLSRGDIGAMWLDLLGASARLGLDQPDAIDCYVRAAHTADRLNAHHALDWALQGLAVIAAEAGLAASADALVAYAEANLSAARMTGPGQTWMQARLDRALATPQKRACETALHRSDLLQLITKIKTSLSRADPDSPRATI
jgi:predicted ATPase/class 3 adenylate cyclase